MSSLQNKEVQIQHLGTMRYKAAWDYQDALFQGIIQQKIANRDLPEAIQSLTPNYLLFCEHPHVYTLGKSGHQENLLMSPTELADKAIDYFHINRGGDITYHGYGQVVGYPILDLDNFFTDIHKYLRLLEEMIILTLAEYGIRAGRIPQLTGVWIDYEEQKNPRKICAMGVRTSRWVTMHGFALNVNTDLNFFNHIVPCGITDKAVTSMEKELGYQVDMQEVEAKLVRHFADLFQAIIVESKVSV
ncbi:MAG: lipoyl(octanoyl) transferase LipB [Thermoflexibacteraceae bacterium]